MSSTGKPQILAVEDNPETQLLLWRLFEDTYVITVASGVEEALEIAKERAFDVFLLDINLGKGRDGIDLLNLLREKNDVENAPAVALTAYAMPGDKEKLLDEGFDEYVSKPFTREEVTQTVDQLLPRS